RPHQLAIRLDPVGDDIPLDAVPLLEFDRPAALVVAASHLQRLHEAGRAELPQPRLRDLEVFEGPANLLRGHDFAFSELGLGSADGLDGDDAEYHAPVVIDRPDARLVLHVALVLAVDDFHYFLDYRIVRAGDIEACSDETF